MCELHLSFLTASVAVLNQEWLHSMYKMVC